MNLTEEYKIRLLELAGIDNSPENFIFEVIDIEIDENMLSEDVGDDKRQPIRVAPKAQIQKVISDPYSEMKHRFPFSIKAMVGAIEKGQEIGMVFQAKNERYTAPIHKARVVLPFALGSSARGKIVIRAVHLEGQSEWEARKTNPRRGGAMASEVWRLFSSANIKSMFYTLRYFTKVPGGMPPFKKGDKQIRRIIAEFDPNKAKQYQQSLPQPITYVPGTV